MDYTKIIFVSKENVLLGPMAEWIMKSILMDKSKQIMSRGLVVLFAEPRDQRVTELLMNHGVPCEEQVSEEFHAEQVDETTLVLTMNFTEKVKVLEDYGVTEHVYTLREFVQEEDGIPRASGLATGSFCSNAKRGAPIGHFSNPVRDELY